MTPAEVATKLRAFNDWRRGGDIEYPGPLAVDEAIDAAVEMIDRLEAAESALSNLGVTSEEAKEGLARHKATLARLEAAEKERELLRARNDFADEAIGHITQERDALRAKIAEMERQEPVAEIGQQYTLLFAGSGSITEVVKRHGLKIGDKLYALPGAQPAPSVPDGVAEALQRLIENGSVLGPSSSEDALLVARYRQHLLSSAPSISPAALRPVIQWLRNGCDPMKAAKELEILIAAAPEAKP